MLRRLKAEHAYGPGCYGAGGCAEIVEALAQNIDARRFNPSFPASFPRFVQHALWRFCAQGQFDICNGNPAARITVLKLFFPPPSRYGRRGDF